ncbi:hypothetical protein FB451DRAFT_1231633 [Mycena latifolia]|nr:hypothetical protein FB451DRAFT_1231633 [Mycena latifolia]
MFSSMKLYATVLAFTAAVKAVSDLQVPVLPASGGSMTITWSSDDSDVNDLTVALYPPPSGTYSGGFAIANNVNPRDNKATIAVPEVEPGAGYTVALISMSDTSKVLAQSTTFPVGAPAPEPSTTAPSASSPASTKHISASASVHASASTASGSHTASAASASHSGSDVASASHSASLMMSVTAPLASASSAILTVPSAAHSILSSPVGASAAHSEAPSASASTVGRTGAALSLHVPSMGLALVLGGLLVGALAL